MARSFDDAIDALADVQRRRLLVALLEHNPQDVTSDTDAADDTAGDDHQLQMAHNHLPKLDRYGYIDWDRRSHQVVKGRNFDEIKPLLELLNGHEDELPQDWV